MPLVWITMEPITEVIKSQDEDLISGSLRIYFKLLVEDRHKK